MEGKDTVEKDIYKMLIYSYYIITVFCSSRLVQRKSFILTPLYCKNERIY